MKLSTQHFGDRPTTTKRNLTPPDAVPVAIDMSKHRQGVLIERPEGGRRWRMAVMATKSIDQRSFGRSGTGIGVRLPRARFRPRPPAHPQTILPV